MGILFGFAPWIVFWVLVGNNTFQHAALAAFVASVIISARGLKQKNIKVLELGTVLFFLVLAVITIFAEPIWLEKWTHLLGNAALLLISLVSLVIGKPFTIQYAREQTPEEHWTTPLFYSINKNITLVWTAAFAVQTVSSALTVIWPHHETWFSWIIPLGAFVGAVKFTGWYPKQFAKEAAD
jgi:uncharacterized membrane protein